MQTLKQWAIAGLGAIALGGFGMGAAPAADIPVQPGPTVYQRVVPQYGPAEIEVYPDAPPPVVYRYAPPPPVVYYDYPPPVVVYPPRYRYAYGGYGYPRYHGYRGHWRGHGHYGRHWHR